MFELNSFKFNKTVPHKYIWLNSLRHWYGIKFHSGKFWAKFSIKNLIFCTFLTNFFQSVQSTVPYSAVKCYFVYIPVIPYNTMLKNEHYFLRFSFCLFSQNQAVPICVAHQMAPFRWTRSVFLDLFLFTSKLMKLFLFSGTILVVRWNKHCKCQIRMAYMLITSGFEHDVQLWRWTVDVSAKSAVFI